MKLTPLVPAPPEDGAGPRWGLAASAVGHGLLIAALLAFAIRQLPPGGSPAPSYDLVFQGPAGGAPPTTAPQTQKLPPAQPADVTPPPDAVLGPPAPTPLTTPDPAATTSPPPAADTAPPPPVVPDVVPPAPTPAPSPSPTPVQAAPSAAAPPPVAPAAPDEAASIPLPTPLETPPTAEPPAVRLELPPTETAPATQAPIMPQPPPPLPPIEQRPPQPPRPVVRQAPRSAFGTLSNPMNLSLAPSAPRPAARGSVASRSLDLSPPQAHDGPASSDPYAQIRAAAASADWNRGLLQYWLQHRFYPEQARINGDQGSVTIQLTVNRSGRVENVEVLSRSGSQWLDMAALSTWRNARLPPFTNEMREDRITFPIPIQYTLIR